MEYIDTFDVNYNHIGKEEKDKAHLDGLWHQTFHCWIIRPNNKILFQLRSKIKDVYPDKLDISAAGHITAGETAIEGIREIKEELGIDVDENRLVYLGTYQEANDIPTKKGVFHNYEFVHMYFLKDDTNLEKFTMQDSEVDGIYDIEISDLLKLFNGEVSEISISGINREKNRFERINVNKESFVDRSKYYYTKLCIMAERFANDEKYLGF